MAKLVSGARIRIISGNPTAEEVVAVLVALDQAAVTQPKAPAGIPPWQRAARLEGLSGAPLSSAADPRLQRAGY
jgi:hypothetical protein